MSSQKNSIKIMNAKFVNNLKITIFTNNSRGLEVIKFFKKKNIKIFKIIIAKKNLNIAILNFLKKNKIAFVLIKNLKRKIVKTILKNSDIGLVCGFPYIFSNELIKYPKHGLLNLHAGRLPKYRGGSPLNWQILNKEKYFGITVIKINKGIDTGDIICEKKFKLLDKYCIEDLQKIANQNFPVLLYKSILKVISKKKLKKQKSSFSSYYKQRNMNSSQIDIKKIKFKELKLLYRATSKTYQNPYFFFKNKKVVLNSFKKIKKNYTNYKSRIFIINNEIYLKIKDSIVKILKSNYKKKDFKKFC